MNEIQRYLKYSKLAEKIYEKQCKGCTLNIKRRCSISPNSKDYTGVLDEDGVTVKKKYWLSFDECNRQSCWGFHPKKGGK